MSYSLARIRFRNPYTASFEVVLERLSSLALFGPRSILCSTGECRGQPGLDDSSADDSVEGSYPSENQLLDYDPSQTRADRVSFSSD